MGKWFKNLKSRLGHRLALADKLTACLALLLVAGSLVTVVPAFAAGEVDSNLGGTDVSISRFSEVIAESFNNGLSNAYMRSGQAKVWMDTVDANTDWTKRIGLATIGNLLGYPSGNDDAQNTSNVWTKGTDAASKVMTLQTVNGFYGEAASEDSAMSQYIIFGSMLNYLGVDEFRDAQSASNGIRTLVGYAIYVCFMLAHSANTIMSEVVKLLEKFNIFQLMWDGTLELLADANIGGNGFVDEIKSAIDDFKIIRWLIFGILVVLFAATTTIWKSKAYSHAANVQQKGRRLAYRIIVMAIGLPLCGMVYSEAIDMVDASAKSSKVTLTDYIFQEFLDFEKWTIGSVDRETGKSTAFKVDSLTGMSKIDVEYTTSMQQFVVETGGVSGGASGDSLDASKFVFAINRSMYPYIGSVDNANFIQSLFKGSGAAGSTGRFSSINDSGNKAGEAGFEEDKAYNAARNLILNYAKSNTVSPDTLNDVFLKDYDDMLVAMGTDTDAETISTAIEQLFGINAAQQRIWSYIEKSELTDDSRWIYEHDDGPLTLLLAGAIPNQIKCECKGISAFPSDTSYVGVSGVFINGTKIMVRTLANGTGADAPSISVMGTKSIERDGANNEDYKYKFTYSLDKGGMSALALYNYMHTKFENGQITVYSPDNTTNAGVGLMHYSVTTPYSGIPEIVQLLYILAILFCLGIIGWVFGISLLMNTIVMSLKAIPVAFKMFMGSVDSLVEGFLIVLSIAAELLVTVFLYAQAVNIIDLLIELVRAVANSILTAFSLGSKADSESYAIMSGIISIFIIVWGTFELIKWRQAITISIKSIITHLLNTVFGTNAAMPTGASNGMLKNAAALAAGGMALGALAQDGALDDVVNDLTGTDLGSSIHDKLSEGDWEGALQDMQDYAGGTYRGSSDTADAEAALGEGGDIGSANGWQSLTDQDKAEMDEKYGDALEEADENVEAAEQALADGTGSQEDLDKANAERDALRQEVAEDAAKRRHANYEKANELGVADYGDYLRAQDAEAEAAGLQPIEGADIPDEPSKTLDRDAHMAYDAARDGDDQTLRTAAQKFDGNGLTAAQREKINQMIANGADETEIAAAIDNMKQDNFGDDADAVVDKINEAAGRDGTETYGSSDNSNGDARTVTVSGHKDGTTGGLEYAVTDNNSDAGQQRIKVSEADGQSTYENVTDGSDGKGDQIVTADMGTQEAQDAMAMDYADIRNNMDSVANMTGDMLVKGSGSGGFGKTTVSEAAAEFSGLQSQAISGGSAGSDYGSGGGFTQTQAMDAINAAGVTDLSQAGAQEAAGGVNITPQQASVIGGAVGAFTGSGTAGMRNIVGNSIAAPSVGASMPIAEMSGGNVVPAASFQNAPPAPSTQGVQYTQSNVDGGTVTVPMSSDGKTYVQQTLPNGTTQYVEATGNESGGQVFVKQSGSGGVDRYVPLDSAQTRYTEVPSGNGSGTVFMPASDDGVMYVQQPGSNGTKFVPATGHEAAGTQGYVMQRDESGVPQYIEADIGTKYVQSPEGGYHASGSRSVHAPTTVSTSGGVIDYSNDGKGFGAQMAGAPPVPSMGVEEFQHFIQNQHANSGTAGSYTPVTLSPEQLQQFLSGGDLNLDDVPGNVIGE